MFSTKIKLLIGIGIVLVVFIPAIRKSRAHLRELEAADANLTRVNEDDVLKSYYQMVGMDGFAVSQLAPYGRVMIYGKVFEACCEESVVEKGDSIEVVGVNGRVLTVKKIDDGNEDFPEDEIEENVENNEE